MVKVYKLSMSPTLYNELGLEVSQYALKEKAIEVVAAALTKNETAFTYEVVEGVPTFKNTSGGELVCVVE